MLRRRAQAADAFSSRQPPHTLGANAAAQQPDKSFGDEDECRPVTRSSARNALVSDRLVCFRRFWKVVHEISGR